MGKGTHNRVELIKKSASFLLFCLNRRFSFGKYDTTKILGNLTAFNIFFRLRTFVQALKVNEPDARNMYKNADNVSSTARC